MTTTTSASVTPILLSATPTPTAGGMSIDLVFNTSMAAGSGTIFITDGAVQTVIDRVTGQPTMRVVGATDTHTISATSVSVDGAHVRLTVPGLLPGHEYSIVMGAGVLASSAQVAFAGLRSTSQLQFSTAAVPDHEGPSLVSSDIDGSLLASGGSLHVTLTFSEAVNGLTADALGVPNATVSALVAVGDGHRWQATLTAAGPVEQAGNVLTVDMSKVHDAAGNAGSGSAHAGQTYDVDTKGPSASIVLDRAELRYGGGIGMTLTLSDRGSADDLVKALAAQNAVIDDLRTTDDGLTWTATLRSDGNAVAGGNTVSLDLSKLHDGHGNAGAGIVQSTAYSVDNAVSTYVGQHIGIIDQYGPGDDDHVSNEAQQSVSFSLSGPLADGQHIEVSIDGRVVSSDGLRNDGNDWYLESSDTQFADGTHTFAARVVDSAAHGSAAVAQQFTIDTVAPTLEHWPEGAIAIGAPDALELRFDEAVYLPGEGIESIVFTGVGGTSIRVELNDSFLSEDHKTLTIRADQHHLQAGQDYQFQLPAGLTDLAGNAVPSTMPLSLHVASNDLLAPSATSAIAQVDKGPYGIGTDIRIAIAFSEAVKLAGSGEPVLHLNNGGVALFDHISPDQHTVVFKYTVGANNESDTANLQLDGSTGLVGHVSDQAGNLLDLAHIDYSTLGNLGSGGNAGPIRIDAHGPATPGMPVLDASSDSGYSHSDGITNHVNPTITGTAAEPGNTISIYEGATLLGTTTADVSGKWSFTVGSQPGRLASFADGVHTLTVTQADAAGNLSAPSTPLAITIDTVAPTIRKTELDWDASKHRFEMEFSERIVFASNGAIDVLDTLNLSRSHHVGSTTTNWEIGTNDAGVASVLELGLSGLLGLFGNFHLKADNGAIQDLAGNAAVIGIPTFIIPGLTL
jgi:hypothetical protein